MGKYKKLKVTKKKVKITSNPNTVNILVFIPQAFHLPSIHNPSNLYVSPQLGSQTHCTYSSVTWSFHVIHGKQFLISLSIMYNIIYNCYTEYSNLWVN